MEHSRYKIQFATQMDVLYSTFAFISARGVVCIITARIYSRFSEGNKTSVESNIAATRFQKLFTHESFRQSQEFSYRTIYKRNWRATDEAWHPFLIHRLSAFRTENFICWHRA